MFQVFCNAYLVYEKKNRFLCINVLPAYIMCEVTTEVRRDVGSLGTELQTAVCHHVGSLGIEPWSSEISALIVAPSL